MRKLYLYLMKHHATKAQCVTVIQRQAFLMWAADCVLLSSTTRPLKPHNSLRMQIRCTPEVAQTFWRKVFFHAENRLHTLWQKSFNRPRHSNHCALKSKVQTSPCSPKGHVRKFNYICSNSALDGGKRSASGHVCFTLVELIQQMVVRSCSRYECFGEEKNHLTNNEPRIPRLSRRSPFTTSTTRHPGSCFKV